jgi:hypothetical protein
MVVVVVVVVKNGRGLEDACNGLEGGVMVVVDDEQEGTLGRTQLM